MSSPLSINRVVVKYFTVELPRFSNLQAISKPLRLPVPPRDLLKRFKRSIYKYFFLSFREFRNSYGTKFFASDPPEDDIVEEEVVTHVVGKKPLLGKVWKTETGDIVRYRCYSYGIEYKIGDPVFIESQRPEQPFHICCIQVS